MKRFSTNSVALGASQRSKFAPALLLVLGSFTLITAASAANIVVNGGFEQPVVSTNEFGRGWATYAGENDDGFDCPNDGHCVSYTEDNVTGWEVFWTDDILDHNQVNPGRLELQHGLFPGITSLKGGVQVPIAQFKGNQRAELDSHHRIDDNPDDEILPNTNVTIAQLPQTCPRTAYTLSYAWKSRTIIESDNDVRVVVDGTEVRKHLNNSKWETETVHFVSNHQNATLLIFSSIGTTTTHGMFLDEVVMDGPDGSDLDNCEAPEGICEFGKPKALTMLYDGNDLSDHSQDGNEVIIYPEFVESYPNPARIKVYGHKKKNPKQLGETLTVQIGETFAVLGDRYRIPARLMFEIIDPATNEVVQTVQFHSSCSQPLDTFDEFGGLTVWSADH